MNWYGRCQSDEGSLSRPRRGHVQVARVHSGRRRGGTMAIVVLVLWLFTPGAGFYLLVTSNIGRARPVPNAPAPNAPAASVPVPNAPAASVPVPNAPPAVALVEPATASVATTAAPAT